MVLLPTSFSVHSLLIPTYNLLQIMIKGVPIVVFKTSDISPSQNVHYLEHVGVLSFGNPYLI
uniref:Uncharacterized protein n=1 Tax=Rhizophora mucronata TaxID=61149 RepID=A0A2P2R0Z5_RHIMU